MSDLVHAVADVLAGLKLTDIIAYDFREYSPLFDYVMIASASSERQVHASIHHMVDAFHGKTSRFKFEGAQASRWILFDLGDIIIHVMHKEERDYYSLEKLYIERSRVDLGV
jgi:ribosome-associated protein